MNTIYDFTAKTIECETISLAEFRGQVLLIVNVASRCGFTVQYAALQALYRKYADRGFAILGFPCNQFLYQEPGSESSIQSFCQARYDVTFPMFSKIDVNGPNSHPVYRFLKSRRAGWLGVRRIGWNFSKFLIDRHGAVVARYSSFATPDSIAPAIERLLNQSVPEKTPLAD
jgi:glutathione peroxidase